MRCGWPEWAICSSAAVKQGFLPRWWLCTHQTASGPPNSRRSAAESRRVMSARWRGSVSAVSRGPIWGTMRSSTPGSRAQAWAPAFCPVTRQMRRTSGRWARMAAISLRIEPVTPPENR